MKSHRFAAAIAVVVMTVVPLMQWAAPAAADTGADEVAMAAEINGIRGGRGLRPLAIKGELFDLARAWSRQQAAAGTPRHNPRLAQQLPKNWIRMGENVAAGPDTWAMFDALVASPAHFAHMVDPRFDSIGIGIVEGGGGYYYATMVFMTTASTTRARRSA